MGKAREFCGRKDWTPTVLPFFFFFSFSVLALAVFPDKWIQLSSKEDASLKAVPHMFGD